jgi:hypothetical protein
MSRPGVPHLTNTGEKPFNIVFSIQDRTDLATLSNIEDFFM